jgi:group II intron reverse transcriptase/maturase
LALSLRIPDKVEKLRKALHAKAKGSPEYRFYMLYDKIYRPDVLLASYRRCRSKDGAPGVDEQTFEDIEAYGEERWLGELTEELRRKEYTPQAVRRVWIPKANGKMRPLGIPTIRDRVVQGAAVLVMEPIFEADLQPEQKAYRPGRGAHEALEQIDRLLYRGYTEVVDADLSGYFDSIPHSELMKSVARRISDKHVLRLIKMWLVAPVEETDERGRKRRTTLNRDTGRGIPQGAPISPLLSNLYMRRFALGWKVLGHERRLSARIVNYADDFVICCCRGMADKAMAAMRDMMGRLRLTVNETKTRLCRIPEEKFDFLGYTFGQYWSPRLGRLYVGKRPSLKALKAIRRDIHAQTTDRWEVLSTKALVAKLNPLLRGWANYFRVGAVSEARDAVDAYAFRRICQWWVRKHKIRTRGSSRFTSEYLYRQSGLLRLSELRTRATSAKA